MGCDIHAYIDYDSFVKHDGDIWIDCFAELHLGRDYELFNQLAGVRGNGGLFSPRGLPQNVSFWVECANVLYVSDPGTDEGCCSRENAELWVQHGSSKWVNDDRSKVTHPDWHSHSYLYVHELQQVKKALNYPNNQLGAVIAAMKSLNGKDSKKSRFVFWFDN